MLLSILRVVINQNVARHTASYRYQKQEIKYDVWTHKGEPLIHTILFLGTVQVGEMPKHISRLCPPGTAVIQGAPHWKAKPSSDDLIDFMYEFTKQAFEYINLNFHRAKFVTIIAESQAAPGALRLASSFTSQVENLVLIQPLGLNSSAFTGSASERAKELFKRAQRNVSLQVESLMKDQRMIRNYLLMLGVNVRETILGKTSYQYGVGLSYSAIHDLAKVARKTIIIIGTLDQLFPYKEIVTDLASCDIDNIRMVRVQGVAHAPLGSRTGSKLLACAFELLKKP